MAKTKVVAGIDLGSSKVATIIAQVQVEPVSFETSVNVVGAASVESKGIKKGQIVDIEEAVESTIASVEAAERMAGYNLGSVCVALGGAHIASQNSQGVVAVSDPNGEISFDDVERVIEAASAISLPSSREIIHVLPREFVVDGESGIKDPVGMSGVRLEVETHIVTASQASLKNFRKAIYEVGVEVEEVVFSGLASSEAVLSKTEKELGCVLVDIGGGNTSIAVYVDGSLHHSSVIPIGGNNVTNDMAIGLRTSLESAEKVKLALSEHAISGKSIQKEGLEEKLNSLKLNTSEINRASLKMLVDGIIRPRLNEIFTMVRLDLEKAGLSVRVPSGVIVTGGGSMTIGALESGKRMLSLPVRLGLPKGIAGLIDDVVDPIYATPVGLILYAAKRDVDQPDFPLGKRLRLPSKGITGKILETLKDLLP